jgi:EpsI family protein
MRKSLFSRMLVTIGLLAGGIVLLHSITRVEPRSLRHPLRGFPVELGQWRGTEVPIEARIIKAVGVDDHLNRGYIGQDGRAVQLYIGYYGSQRTGDTIHSPKNCLPGAGWEPVRASELRVPLSSGAWITVNDYLIRKGAETQLVLYWYQARGRTIPNEYMMKLWMARDALMRHRTDAALVRVVTAAGAGESQARERAVDFVRFLFPHLRDFIPD